MAFVRADDGARIAYEASGEGVPLVWLHGFPFHRGLWAPQLAGLADVARGLAPDLRGFGASDLGRAAVTVDRYADDVAALLDALGIETAVVGGLSMGGYVAFAFARRHPGRLRGLVLADTRAEPDTPEAQAARRATAERVRREGVAGLVEEMWPRLVSPTTARARPDAVSRLREIMAAARPDGVVAALLAMAARPDARGLLPSLQVPALVLVGRDDTITPPAVARALADALPRARYVEIPDAGHVSNLEQPERFNAAVREFLAALP